MLKVTVEDTQPEPFLALRKTLRAGFYKDISGEFYLLTTIGVVMFSQTGLLSSYTWDNWERIATPRLVQFIASGQKITFQELGHL